MKINYNVQGKERRQLANIIAETINEEVTYMNAPSYAYKTGMFTVTREGVVEFDSATVEETQIKAVINALQENGFSYSGSESLAIGFPLEGFTPETLDNLNKMIQSKEQLIKKALGVDSLPVEQGETELTFPWFRSGLSREETFAYAQFITQLCKTAKAKKRVTAKVQEVFENEKFSCRVWLISLGMVGAEFAAARKLMMQNLDGNSGFRYPDEESRKPRGERVQKEVISVRLTPETLEKLTELASRHEGNMSRNMLIESVINEYVQSEYCETASESDEQGDNEYCADNEE